MDGWMDGFIMRSSYSLDSHECESIGRTESFLVSNLEAMVSK